MNNSCTFTQRLSELNAVDSLCKTAPYTKCMPTQIVFTNQISVSHLTSALKATFHSCNFEGTQKYNRTLTKAQQHVYLHGVNCMHRSARTRDPNSNPPKRSKFWSRSFGPPQYFFDGWRVEPSLKIPDNLPQTQDMPVRITARAPVEGAAPARQPLEDEARDILAAAVKNQVECGPGTRRAAVRAIKYLRTLVNKHGATISEIHTQARLHTQKSKGMIEPGKWYQPTGEALPVISKELTSELLHCLSALPDPWPLAKITIDLEKPGRWVTKMARLYFSDDCARRTDRIPNKTRSAAVEAAMEATGAILPKLEARMIEFLAEWLVSLLMPGQGILEVRAPHLSFMLQKDYWFREIYLGLKVTASFGRSESYTRVVDGQVRYITPDSTSQQLQVVWNV